MHHHPKIKIPFSLRSLSAGIEIELFVAGVLTMLLALVCVRAFLPEAVLPGVGVAAFFLFLMAGAAALRMPKQARRLQPILWGVAAAFSIVWIAAGRLAGTGTQDRFLPF